jgi:hypothetical protein
MKDEEAAGAAHLRAFLENLFWEIEAIPGLTDGQRDELTEIKIRVDGEVEATVASIFPPASPAA